MFRRQRFPSVETPSEFDSQAFLSTLTGGPGVYRMLDGERRVLYVGKARSLSKRVASYFRAPVQLEPKTRVLMSQVASVEITATHTETEALLLENSLIKEHRPRYNILLRDDKSFPYIHVATQQTFPRLAFHRGARNRPGRYFGPFASAGATRETLNLLQKLFQVRQCEDSFYKNRSRPCLQHQIRRCTAPCVGLVEAERYREDVRHVIMFLEGKSEEMIGELVTRMESASRHLEFELASRYRDQIASLRRVQERQHVIGAKGDVDVVASRVRDGVAVVQLTVVRNGQSLGSRTLLPRQAGNATEGDVLDAFLSQYYLSRAGRHNIPSEILVSEPIDSLAMLSTALGEQSGRRVRLRHRVRGERARWIEMTRQNAELAVAQRLADEASLRTRFEALQDWLEFDEVPGRIECFDISHTAGEAAVASCVVFEPTGPLKAEYRRFNIADIEPGDDYAALEVAVRRRYVRVRREEGKLPDLLMVDGGRGQLAGVREILADLQLEEIPVMAVAKGSTRKPGLESIFLGAGKRAFALSDTSPALHLIQQIRDEAHRFAITGHRNRRKRSRNTSVLEQIPGIGAKRRQRLLSEFGGLRALSRAGVEDLARVNGISRTLARAIYDAFRDGP